MRFNQQFITSVIPEAQFHGADVTEFSSVSIDSRTLNKGELFVAIKGNQADGHDFIAEAVKKGAVGLMIDASKEKAVLKQLADKDLKALYVVVVPNTTDALLSLAKEWRSHFEIAVIGITGSLGKTTTKEMVSNILRLSGKKYIASRGNQNTTLGVALNILRIRPEHKAVVLEMGVSHRGEMARMAELAMPNIGIITSIGHSHMEGLGSLTDIVNEKRDVFKYFKEDNIGIVNGDQELLSKISYTHPVIRYGSKTTNQVQARKIQANPSYTTFVLKLYKDRYPIRLETSHTGRVYCALAAASAAYLLGIDGATIAKGLQEPLMIEGRFEHTQLKADKGILINDAYNASPESMKAALLAFEKVESKGQKIAVLGDMLELGVNSPFWHRQLGRFLRKVPSLEHVILVGELVKYTKDTVPQGITFEHVDNWEDAVKLVKKRLNKEAAILVKGSNGVKLSNLVGELTVKQKQ